MTIKPTTQPDPIPESQFLPPPDDNLLRLIREAKYYGTSDSLFSRYVRAPLKAVSAAAIALSDVVIYPLGGLGKAIVVDILDLSPLRATQSIIMGTLNGARSLIQMAMIVSTLFVGIIIPPIIYGALPDVLTTEEIIQKKVDLLTKRRDVLLLEVAGLEQRVTRLEETFQKLGTANAIAGQLVGTLNGFETDSIPQLKASIQRLVQSVDSIADPTQSKQYVELLKKFEGARGELDRLTKQTEEVGQQLELAINREKLIGTENARLTGELEHARKQADQLSVLQEQLQTAQTEAAKAEGLKKGLDAANEQAKLVKPLQEQLEAKEATLSDIKKALITSDAKETFKAQEALTIFKLRREHSGLAQIIKALEEKKITSLTLPQDTLSGKLLTKWQLLQLETEKHQITIASMEKQKESDVQRLKLAVQTEQELNAKIEELKAQIVEKDQKIKQLEKTA